MPGPELGLLYHERDVGVSQVLLDGSPRTGHDDIEILGGDHLQRILHHVVDDLEITQGLKQNGHAILGDSFLTRGQDNSLEPS